MKEDDRDCDITMVKEHYYWIDWMKVFGMYFIVAGHFFIGHEFVNIPLNQRIQQSK